MAAASWLELPRDLLGAIIARLDLAADVARLRTVCRCWHSAVHELAPSRGRRPRRIILPAGYPDDDNNTGGGGFYVLPNNTRCIGSAGCWLALAIDDEDEEEEASRWTYYMYNPYSATTVPLPELDAVIVNASELFEVRKVLMRSSTPDDVIALLTNNYNHPLILVRPGKGAWLPKPQEVPYVYLIDIAFLGDKLYGITQAEDLVAITLAFDNGAGTPLVTGVERVIRQKHADGRDDDDDDSSDTWSEADVLRVMVPWELTLEHDDGDDDDDARTMFEFELMRKTGDDTILRGGVEFTRGNDDFPFDFENTIITIWYFFESTGKLFMLRRKLHGFSKKETRRVEVFQADVEAGTWTAAPAAAGGGLIGQQALFISRCSSRSVPASEEAVADSISFADGGDVFDMRSQAASSVPRKMDYGESTWLFHPELVV